MAFIALEGLDGSGKSTLIARLERALESSGKTLRVTREPGGTPLAEKLRQLVLEKGDEAPHPRTEVLIYEAARAQHVEEILRPHLEKGDWVLCDRFFASTVAFQVFGRNLDRNEIDWLNQYATGGLSPDLTVYLDLTVEASRSRMKGRSKDRMESEAESFHERVRQGYLAQAAENPKTWIVLSSEKTPEELEQAVLKKFRECGWLD